MPRRSPTSNRVERKQKQQSVLLTSFDPLNDIKSRKDFSCPFLFNAFLRHQLLKQCGTLMSHYHGTVLSFEHLPVVEVFLTAF